jgi:hypothetical protein
MTLPAPIFAGFFPKATQPRPDWLKVDSVEEIASVSDCISAAPPNWIQHWTHNALGFYDSQAAAEAILEGAAAGYDLYAYEMFPFHCLDRKVESVPVERPAGRVPPDFDFLGYDIVTRSTGSFFECSPLSCNHVAQDYATNAHCLLDDEALAYQALLAMSEPGSGVEPGPYYLFKVYRKKPAAHSKGSDNDEI